MDSITSESWDKHQISLQLKILFQQKITVQLRMPEQDKDSSASEIFENIHVTEDYFSTKITVQVAMIP